jgi:hypothetical protein
MSPASSLRPALLASAALLAVPAIAGAAPAPRAPTPSAPAFDQPHVGVEASLGQWTPLGSAGVTFIASPIPALSFAIGG